MCFNGSDALCAQLVHTLLKQCGVEKRTGDLYGNRDLFNRARNMARGLKVSAFHPFPDPVWVKSAVSPKAVVGEPWVISLLRLESRLDIGSLMLSWLSFLWQGVENVYTQHQPLLAQTIENIVRGRLRDVDYPFVGNHFQQGRLVLSYSLWLAAAVLDVSYTWVWFVSSLRIIEQERLVWSVMTVCSYCPE